MDERSPSAVAPCCSLAAFAVAMTAGVAAGNEVTVVIGRALVSMAGGYAVGLLISAAVSRIVREHLDTYRHTNPIPTARGSAVSGAPGAEAEAG